MALGDKRVAGVSAQQTYRQAAQRVLRHSLGEVMHWLPRAVLAGGESDDEIVHRLRVSTRRAVEAVRVFSDLIGEQKAENLRSRLRQIRKAADEARNFDVLLDQFTHPASTSEDSPRAKIAVRIRHWRRDVQKPIVAIYQQLARAKFKEQIAALLDELGTHQTVLARRRFGRHAARRLTPVVKKFFKAARADVSDDEKLHRLRIEAKKLRYTIEIVASAFKPSFVGQIYRKLCEYQDVMGLIRDHAMAHALFASLLAQTTDPCERACLEGMVFSEDRARRDLKKAFEALWTRKTVARLQWKFAPYCEEEKAEKRNGR